MGQPIITGQKLLLMVRSNTPVITGWLMNGKICSRVVNSAIVAAKEMLFQFKESEFSLIQMQCLSRIWMKLRNHYC